MAHETTAKRLSHAVTDTPSFTVPGTPSEISTSTRKPTPPSSPHFHGGILRLSGNSPRLGHYEMLATEELAPIRKRLTTFTQWSKFSDTGPLSNVRKRLLLPTAFLLLLASAFVAWLVLRLTSRWPGDNAFRLHPSVDLRDRNLIHPNGHLYVPATSIGAKSAIHPIPALIRNATISWNARVARQSKTLAAAVSEYKRRYHRQPPRGFDRWFEFARQNDIVLIDEYDGIWEDIGPFWALEPRILRERMAAFASTRDTHTLVIRDGDIDIFSGGGEAGLARARDQRELLSPCKTWLSDTNITISPHDGPSVLMDENHKRRHREAGERGEILSADDINTADDDPALWGFSLACPADSRLRRAFDGLEMDALPQGPNFIHNHIAAMDLCENPEWQDLHGFTAWPGPRPSTLQPVFSMSKSTMHSDIRLTPLEQFFDAFDTDPSWEEKSDERAVWRGSTTGVWFDRVTRWRSSQRVRLYWLSTEPSGTRMFHFVEPHDPDELILERPVPLADLYRRYLDFAFVGDIVQCTEEDGGCQAAEDNIQLGKGMIWNDQNRYKYLLDIDGNAWSGRFHRLLSTNSLVLKATIFKEWYAERIQPWLHYVPIDPSYSDLFDVLSFFSGDLDGSHTHDELARTIAYAGRDWAAQHWRIQDMQACKVPGLPKEKIGSNAYRYIATAFGMGTGDFMGPGQHGLRTFLGKDHETCQSVVLLNDLPETDLRGGKQVIMALNRKLRLSGVATVHRTWRHATVAPEHDKWQPPVNSLRALKSSTGQWRSKDPHLRQHIAARYVDPPMYLLLSLDNDQSQKTMMLTAGLQFRAVKGCGGTPLRMVSEAKTGTTFHTRVHLDNTSQKVQLMHYDPIVNTHVLFTSTRRGVSGAGVRPKRKIPKRFSPPIGILASQRHRVRRT